jgi:hypothetical protein
MSGGSSTVLAIWIWGSSTMLATGVWTDAGRKAGLERRLKKKTGLDMSKTLRRESAIALRYRRRLAGGASNPNVTKTMYHMRTLDEQASDSKN